MESTVRDVVIIGSGPAGYTAALYAARAGLSSLVIAGTPTIESPERLPGGQLVATTSVENFPGFPDGVDGSELMERMRAQAERHGAEVWLENATALNVGSRPFEVRTDERSVQAHAVVVATGASARWLGVPGEAEYRNRGVFGCATCDGPLVQGLDVVVVGGGDTALEEAIYLARFARRVTLVHRRDTLRASYLLRARAADVENLSFAWNREVEAVRGDGERVTEVRLRDTRSGERTDYAADAIFVAIGRSPATSLLGDAVARDEHGYVATAAGSTRTNIPGIFAAGDLIDPIYRQAITAAASGAMAALDAQRWLEGLPISRTVRTAA